MNNCMGTRLGPHGSQKGRTHEHQVDHLCVRPVPAVVSRPIRIDAAFDDWRDVTPEFRDTVGDPVRRDWKGWGSRLRYADDSAPNDRYNYRAVTPAIQGPSTARAATTSGQSASVLPPSDGC